MMRYAETWISQDPYRLLHITHMSLQERLGEKTLHHLSKAGANHGQEYARYQHMITWLSHASYFATAQYSHATRNVANGHLVTVLLHFDLLELDELGAARLQIKTTAGFVNTAIIGGAILHRYKRQRVDRLICFGATAIASVSGHHHHGLHLRATRHNTTYCDQFSNLLGLHFTNRVRLLRGLWLEANLTASTDVNWVHPATSKHYSQSLHQLRAINKFLFTIIVALAEFGQKCFDRFYMEYCLACLIFAVAIDLPLS